MEITFTLYIPDWRLGTHFQEELELDTHENTKNTITCLFREIFSLYHTSNRNSGTFTWRITPSTSPSQSRRYQTRCDITPLRFRSPGSSKSTSRMVCLTVHTLKKYQTINISHEYVSDAATICELSGLVVANYLKLKDDTMTNECTFNTFIKKRHKDSHSANYKCTNLTTQKFPNSSSILISCLLRSPLTNY